MFWNNDAKNIKLISDNLFKDIETQRILTDSLSADIATLSDKFEKNLEETAKRFKDLYNTLNSSIDIEHDRMESLFASLEKEFNSKIERLSDKPIVTDLLRKIAVLESVKDVISSRRNPEELLAKLRQLDDEFLRLDREEKDTSKVKAQIDILKWALGDI